MDADDDFQVLDAEPAFEVHGLNDAIDAWELDERVRPEAEVERVRWADLKSEDWRVGIPDVEGIGEASPEPSEARAFEGARGLDTSLVNGDLCEQCRKGEIEIRQMETEIDRLRRQNAAVQQFPSSTVPLCGSEGGAKETVVSAERSRAEKERYRLELLEQIQEQKSRAMAEEEWRRLDYSESDLEDANRYAAQKRHGDERSRLWKEEWNESLKLQMGQRQKEPKPVKEAPYWWQIRRPFDDDSKHRLEQTRRNLLLQRSINSLNQFKARQAEEDRLARENQKAKYAKLREKIARESEVVREADFGLRRQRLPKVVPMGGGVGDLWAAEKERNARKYRILQEDGGPRAEHCRVKRCRKCSRIISRA
ncbi:hypothetical protein QR680_017567 [Steinernema hermaphroditum]|uniref:Uncharacterized protein n=1 Tax=Steinernema hermaphroditum TaxID=289476 RepID=A0AA39LPJ6_9BILA|nr:hypothetical protein QR680_017567 [Steinernema hermaphroditum]